MAANGKYKPEYDEQARKLCLLLGATNADLAEFFEVSETSIENWIRRKPSFRAAVKAGKVQADMEVAASLYRQAIGYEYEEEQAIVVKASEHTQRVEKVSVKRYARPEALPGIYFLNNRQREKWRQRVDHEVGGSGGGPLVVELVNFGDTPADKPK